MSRLEEIYQRLPTVMLARRNLSRNGVRSALAMFAIVIGVFAIATLGVVGTTVQIAAVGALDDIGNEIIVNPAVQQGETDISERDVHRVERIASDGPVVAYETEEKVVEYNDDRMVAVAYGMDTPGRIYSAEEGAVPDRLREGVVVGSNVADRFDLREGTTLTVDEESYRVVAILESESAFSPASPNRGVVLPTREVDNGEDGYSSVIVHAASGEDASDLSDELREDLNHRQDRVNVLELQQVTEGLSSFLSVLRSGLMGIGAISLFVAGVSILNVMLITTIERRQEIGTMRAVGVSKRDVMKILVFEAALLGLGGSLVAILLAGLFGLALNWILLEPTTLFAPRNLYYLLLAFCFGVGTAIASGLYPAWKAANERPVETLRG